MIETGKPVFGFGRGLQEINVLFGGTLREHASDAGHFHYDQEGALIADRFALRHDVTLVEHGRLATATGQRRPTVDSVHEQGVDRLNGGLTIEAFAHDGLFRAVAARPCGADVLAVQWHSEWEVAQCAASRTFFTLIVGALRGREQRTSTSTNIIMRGH